MAPNAKCWSMQSLVAACGKAVTSTSSQYTVPVVGGVYDILAVGSSVYALGGTNPVADTSTNYSMIFPESMLIEGVILKDAKIAVITVSGATATILFKLRQCNV